MTVAEQVAERMLADAARASICAGLTLGEALGRMEAAMAQLAVDKFGTKGRAASFLGVHRNPMTRIAVQKRARRAAE